MERVKAAGFEPISWGALAFPTSIADILAAFRFCRSDPCSRALRIWHIMQAVSGLAARVEGCGRRSRLN